MTVNEPITIFVAFATNYVLSISYLSFHKTYVRFIFKKISCFFLHTRKILMSRLNVMKPALRVSLVIAAVANVTCKHGLWLVASRKKTSR